MHNPSGVDPEATDGGSETQGFFRFQHMCTGIIALRMVGGKTEYLELFCELYEDVVGIKENNQYVGIQIKHHNSNSLTINNEKIYSALKKFIENDLAYPNKFDKFIIMSNAEITTGSSIELSDVIHYCQHHKNDLPNEELLLNNLASKCDVDKEKIVKVLSKLETEKVPNKEFLFDHLIAIAGKDVKECKSKNPIQIESIVNSLITLVAEKSQEIPNARHEYFAFRDNSVTRKEDAKILSKRITPPEILNLISSSETFVVLKSELNFPTSLGSIDLIDYKMSLGGIHQVVIKNMKELTINAFHHFFKQEYDDITKQELENKLKHVSVILGTINSESDVYARLKGLPFGLHKLEEMNKKINIIYQTRPDQVYNFSPEILKGLSGLMIMECSIDYSDQPEGGFV